MRWLALTLLCSCAAVPVNRFTIGGPQFPTFTAAQLRNTTPEAAGRCTASERIDVLDAEQHAVEGARVVSELTVTQLAGREVLAVYLYVAGAVKTDALGVAHVCLPDWLLEQTTLGGVAGASLSRTEGKIIVTKDGRTGQLVEPFTGPLKVMLR